MFTVYCTTSIASQSLYPYSCCRTHSRAPRRAGAKQGARRHIACYSQSLDTDEIRHLLGSAYLRPEFEGYTDEHVSCVTSIGHWEGSLPRAAGVLQQQAPPPAC
eukprot:GHUV01034452.1.p1 GENE.GHUV01034452.1~~GHUV01034452.1.p1  ORF type:complete len:104 (+),score=7.98 GHUV01034452.1:75-386(+)